MKRVSASAAGAFLAVGAWLTSAGCLNPRPEEVPTSEDVRGGVDTSANGPDAPLSPDDLSPPAPTPGAAEAPPIEVEGAPADAGAPDAGPAAREPVTDAEPPPETEAGEPPE